MSTNAARAARVAATIGAVKWILIAAQVLIGILATVGANNTDAGGEWGALLVILVPLVTLFYALATWVLFGWFQHTLGMLATIATNTTPTAAGPPQAWAARSE